RPPDLHSFPTRRSSDLRSARAHDRGRGRADRGRARGQPMTRHDSTAATVMLLTWATILVLGPLGAWDVRAQPVKMAPVAEGTGRSEEHTSELQSLRHLV